MKHILLFCCLLAGWNALEAQPIRGSSYDALIEAAELAMAENNYTVALEKYEEAFEKREDEALLPHLAYLNYQLRDYPRAERYYRRYMRRAGDLDTAYNDARFLYGRVLKMVDKPEEAIPVLQEFVRSTTDARLRKWAEAEITGAEMAMEMPETKQGVTVTHLERPINGAFSEYSPVLADNGQTLYFSTWEATDPVVVDDANEPKNFSRIFSSTLEKKEGRDEAEYTKPEPLGGEVNRPGVHTANPALSPEGRRLYYTRLDMNSNIPTSAKIYWSTVGAEGWTSGNEVTGINGDYLSLQPAVGELFGTEVLFFVSDMPGGYGGFDIYYAPYQGDGNYGDPVNLGATINTVGDEWTPFYQNGTLYFSSNGLPTIGGFDIFITEWNGSNWSEPRNAGKAYNTSVDDISFRLDSDGYTGVFTSNRPGEGRSIKGRTCCDDIYAFAVPRIYADLVVGVFSEDRKPLIGATVYLTPVPNNVPEPGSSQTKDKGNRFDFGLDLEKPYLVIADHPQYYQDTFRFNTVGLRASKTYEHRFFLRMKPQLPEYDTIEIEEAIVLENILYDFDDDRIRPEAEIDLQVVYELMNEYPDMIIELGSHTDARGNDEYNRDLSQRRMESARRWLIRKGLPRDRMQAKGYGESVPKTVSATQAQQYDFLKEGDVLTEQFINGLATEEQRETAHQLNRRTEFRILEGPTSIIIKRERLRKREEGEGSSNTQGAPNRNSQPAARPQQTPAPQPQPKSMPMPERKTGMPVPPPDTISPMSSLYRQKDLKGVPIMQFKKRFFDLGKVKKGDKRSFSYEFTNVGDAPLQISIISACDCTTLDYSTRVYKPGESGKIDVIFDSAEKDEAETIDVDIYLENLDKKGNPIVEMLKYKFEIVK